MLTRRRFVSGLGLTAAVLPLDATRAQSISRPARIVVGFPPGGGVDYVARLLVDPLKSFSPAVTVENRAGAGGRIALEATKLAPADGTMMVLTPGDQLALFPHVYKSLAYDPLRDFQPVTTVCTVPFLLTIGPMVPKEVDTPESFIAWCRANPKHSSYATAGAGTRPHFIGTALAKAAGIEFTHVPYQGAQPAIADLLGGHIEVAPQFRTVR